MRGRAVGVSDVQIWDVYPVQGVGIAGTDDVLHVVPGRLRCEADGAHEAAFARAGAALYDSQEVAVPGAEAVVQGVEAVLGVRTQEPDCVLAFHVVYLIFTDSSLCKGMAETQSAVSRR